MFGLFLRFHEAERLDALEKRLQSACLRNETYCRQCGFCCCKRTCVPTPDELEAIAAHLGMTPRECIAAHFAIDERDGVFHVKPLGRNIVDLAGKFIPDERTYNEGACVFLRDENGHPTAGEQPGRYTCAIYAVRPASARAQECWTENDAPIGHEAWKGDALKERFGIDGEALRRTASYDYGEED